MIIRIYLACLRFVLFVLYAGIEGMFEMIRTRDTKKDQLVIVIFQLSFLIIIQFACIDTLSAVNCVYDIVEGEVTQCELDSSPKSDRFHTSYDFYLKEKDSGDMIWCKHIFVKNLRNGMNVKLFVPLASMPSGNTIVNAIINMFKGSVVNPRVIEIDGKETDLANGLVDMGPKARIVMFLICLGFAIRHIRFSKRIYDVETIKKKGALFWNMGKYGLYIFYGSLLFSVLINYQPRIFIHIVTLACVVSCIGYRGYYIQLKEITIKDALKDMLFYNYRKEN